MKTVLTFFPYFIFFYLQGFPSDNSFLLQTTQDSTIDIVCVFYLDDESELFEDVDVFFDSINVSLTTNSFGEITIQNVKQGYYQINCIINNTVILIDKVLLTPPITKIRLYDYMFDAHKEEIDRAKMDIENNDLKILLNGYKPLISYELKKIYEIEKKYSISFEMAGCDPNDGWLYNYKINKFLEHRFGNNWWSEFEKDLENAKK